MTKAEKLKATLMAQMKTISKESAMETIMFLMCLHDISIKDFNRVNKNFEKSMKKMASQI